MGASWESQNALVDDTQPSSALLGGVNTPQTAELDPVDSLQVWSQVRESIAGKLDPQIYSAWVRPLAIRSLTSSEESREVVLEAPNRFSAEHLQRTYSELLKQEFEAVLNYSPVQIRFAASNRDPHEVNREAAQAQEKVRAANEGNKRVESDQAKNGALAKVLSLTDDTNLNPAYNFSNFVVGSCNQFAHAVSLQVSENIGHVYNPFFLYGGVGLGKTHVVNAIGNSVRRRKGKVLLVSSETFVNELISAIRGNKMQQFKTKFRSLDLLIIDDVQFISGKERTQEEFFHTFNELYNRQKQIIITADKLPQELTGLEERLRTRFACGLTVDLQPPDYETRVAIINKKAELLKVHMPSEAAEFLSEHIETNIRELEGALHRVIALSSMRSKPVTLELCQEAVRAIIPEKRAPLTVDRIQRAVAQYYSVSLTDLLGKRRTHNIAFARHVAMYLARTLTGNSYPEIGALFGGRDHSTVIHATRTVEERFESNMNFRSEIQAIQNQIRSEL